MRAAVVGAGLSGLTAAYRLQQAGWEVGVFESASCAGGRVRTHRENGYQVDLGAAAFSGEYAPYLELVHELGLEYRPAMQTVGIPRNGQLHELSMEKMISGGLTTKLLSPLDKLRVARLGIDVARAKLQGQLDYADMRKAAPLDTESSRAYAERKLSGNLDQYLCEPVVRTMLIANTDVVSKVELFSGLANIFASRIYALNGGQGRVTERLAEQVRVHLESPVERVVEKGDGVEVTARTPDGGEHADAYDAAVVAAPLHVAARICPDHEDLLGPLNARLGYTRCLKVAIGFSQPLDSEPFVVQFPSSEDAEIALLFQYPSMAIDRAPAGHSMVDACWETDASRRMMDSSDEAIIERTLETVLRLHPQMRDAVDFTHVTRWTHALPHTSIGAYQRIGEFNALLDPSARIQFAGDYMSAAGQNTAVAFGNRAAERLVAR